MKHGKVLYRYTIKNGKFFIREGVVNHTGFRPLVNFKDGGPAHRCPKPADLNKVNSIGQSLWMEGRDDDKARAMFIEYELSKIEQLREQIDRKYALIEILKEGMNGGN